MFPAELSEQQCADWVSKNKLELVQSDAATRTFTYRLPTVSIEPRDNGDGTLTVVFPSELSDAQRADWASKNKLTEVRHEAGTLTYLYKLPTISVERVSSSDSSS